MWSKDIIKIKNEDGSIITMKYWCKHFDEASEYGIDGGKISVLEIRQNGECVYNFDRGLDIAPKTEEAKNLLSTLIAKYN